MKSVTLVGILLIVFGLGALTFHGVSHESEAASFDLGDIEAIWDRPETLPISSVFGAAAVISGAAIVLATARGRTLAL